MRTKFSLATIPAGARVRKYLRSRALRHLVTNRNSHPWQRSSLDIGRAVGLGDVLMCTPALREVKRKNPNCHIRFFTRYESVLRGLSYVDEVLPYDGSPSQKIYPQYEDAIPPRAHLAKVIGDSLGVTVRDVRPDCIISMKLVEQFLNAWRSLPRPRVIIARRSGPHTPNKDWPDQYWLELVERLLRHVSVIDTGTRQAFGAAVHHDNYVDLRGETTLDEFVAAVAAADLHIGPDSGAMHIAAAAYKPSIVIYGGYICPSNTSYPGNIAFFTPVACSPCWLRDPCPHDLKCLTAILPETIDKAVRSAWSKSNYTKPVIS
jgi:ADP-heptose:LPS heptosyltransferase